MKGGPRLALVLASMGLVACAGQRDQDALKRIEALETSYRARHAQFEAMSATEPLAASALADPGQVIVAIRSGLIEQLAGEVASRYLSHVTLDLGAVKAHGKGKLDKSTFLGKVKLGDWDVRVEFGTMIGQLRAGIPRVSLRAPDLIAIELPVDIEESVGDATLHFAWNSAGIANAVCQDFAKTLTIQGRVLPQRHILLGALQLRNTGDRVAETPRFPDRKIDVRLDLTKDSWNAVERALSAENTVSRCGMFMHPGDGLVFLRKLAAKGVSVRLPDSIFRTIDLPARFQQAVMVNRRSISLEVKAESLRVDPLKLWSSVSVQVQAGTKP